MKDGFNTVATEALPIETFIECLNATKILRDKDFVVSYSPENNVVMDDVRAQNLSRDLPDINDLPEDQAEDLKNFLQEISLLEPLEKIESINRFANNYITPQTEYEEGLATADFLETLSKGSGDCDDFATLKHALLRYADFDDNQIIWFAGDFTYTLNGEDIPDEPGGHVVTFVVEDKDIYLLDVNFGPVLGKVVQDHEHGITIKPITVDGQDNALLQSDTFDLSAQFRDIRSLFTPELGRVGIDVTKTEAEPISTAPQTQAIFSPQN